VTIVSISTSKRLQYSGKPRRRQGCQTPQAGLGQSYPPQATQHAEQQALLQILPADATRAGPHGRPHGHLRLLPLGPHQEEVRHVGAGDEKDDAHATQDDPEEIRHRAHQVVLQRLKDRGVLIRMAGARTGGVRELPGRCHRAISRHGPGPPFRSLPGPGPPGRGPPGGPPARRSSVPPGAPSSGAGRGASTTTPPNSRTSPMPCSWLPPHAATPLPHPADPRPTLPHPGRADCPPQLRLTCGNSTSISRVRLPAYPPTRLPAYPPTRLPAYPPTRLPACPPTRLPECPNARQTPTHQVSF
jgi:hypothetical protein